MKNLKVDTKGKIVVHILQNTNLNTIKAIGNAICAKELKYVEIF